MSEWLSSFYWLGLRKRNSFDWGGRNERYMKILDEVYVYSQEMKNNAVVFVTQTFICINEMSFPRFLFIL